MTRVLLTGARGFIGRHTLDALLTADVEVHAVSRGRGPVDPTAAAVTWHRADLLGAGELVRDVRPDVLVHLAWYTEHGRFWSSPENVRWVEGSLALLRSFVAAGGTRAVFAGSCAEYDWNREVYREDAPTRPATLYGAAKHSLHLLAAAFALQAGVELAWGRVFFLYGPQESPERFVPSLIRPLLRGEPATMSEGSQRRDLMHAADVGAAFAALARSDVTGAVNVASGVGVELRDVGREIARRVGREDLLQIGARPAREGEPPSLVADVTRLREEVGFSQRIALGDGLDQTIAEWRQLARAEGVDA